jgi:hypothetical protein
VRRNYHRGRLGTPKSGLSREVPLSETAPRALAAHRHTRSEDFVFCDAKGNPLTASRMRYELRAICKRAGMRRIGWHVMRHNTEFSIIPRDGMGSAPPPSEMVALERWVARDYQRLLKKPKSRSSMG